MKNEIKNFKKLITRCTRKADKENLTSLIKEMRLSNIDIYNIQYDFFTKEMPVLNTKSGNSFTVNVDEFAEELSRPRLYRLLGIGGAA